MIAPDHDGCSIGRRGQFATLLVLAQFFPAIDAAHFDLPRGRQGPEPHGRRFRVGQRAFRAQELAKKLDDKARGGGNMAMSGLILCPEFFADRECALTGGTMV